MFPFVRENFNSTGFNSQEIDAAMEHVWNQQLACDEFEAVLHHLKLGAVDLDRGSVNIDSKENVCGTISESALKSECTPGHAALLKDISPKLPTSMASKLDVVAGFGNLTDAAFALTEWVVKAAKPEEIIVLCEADETLALQTVIRRAISEESPDSRFISAILPAMLRLLVSLLHKCAGVSQEGMVDVRRALESVLKHSRELVFQYQVETNFPDRVARFVVSRLRPISIQSRSFSAGLSSAAWTSRLGRPLMGIKDVSDDMLDDLLCDHCLQKMSSMKFLLFVHSALKVLDDSYSRKTGEGLRPTIQENFPRRIEKSDIASAIFGDRGDRLGRFQVTNFGLDGQDIIGKSKCTVDLTQAVKDFTAERQAISLRIAELRQSIEKLELYDAELCAKIVEIEGNIKDVNAIAGTNEVSQTPVAAPIADHAGDSIISLVDLLKTYDETLDCVLVSSVVERVSLEIAPGDLCGVASNLARALKCCMLSYYVTSAYCLDVLLGRVHSSEKEVLQLKGEIAGHETLEEAVAIDQLERFIRAKEQSIARDRAMANSISIEATTMLNYFIAQLKPLSFVIGTRVQDLSSIDSRALHIINDSLWKLGVACGATRLRSAFISQEEDIKKLGDATIENIK